MNSSKKASSVLKNSELSIFCYQLALILKSGIPLTEGMKLIEEEMTNPRLKLAVADIHDSVKGGMQLNAALSNQSIFPTFLLNMAKIGETSGKLDEVMDYLYQYYEKADKLNRKIKNAITYPLILAGLMAGVILLLIVKILPMFNDILNSVGGEMPGVTRVMMSISQYIKDYLLVIFLVIFVIAAAIYFFSRSTKGKLYFDKFKINSKLTRNIFQKIYVTKFSMSMALILKSGSSMEEALGMVYDIAENSYVSAKILECRQSLKNGDDESLAISTIGIFPKLFIKMMNIGYKTGELDDMMSKLSVIYENEVDNALQKLTSAIEPILVIVLSAIVGIILLTVMLPLISIMSSIG